MKALSLLQVRIGNSFRVSRVIYDRIFEASKPPLSVRKPVKEPHPRFRKFASDLIRFAKEKEVEDFVKKEEKAAKREFTYQERARSVARYWVENGVTSRLGSTLVGAIADHVSQHPAFEFECEKGIQKFKHGIRSAMLTISSESARTLKRWEVAKTPEIKTRRGVKRKWK